jgi:hypothetical protein
MIGSKIIKIGLIMVIEASPATIAIMKRTLDRELDQLFTQEIWASPRQVVDGLINLITVSGGFYVPPLYPSHEPVLEKIGAIFQQTKAPLTQRQKIFIDLLAAKIKDGLLLKAPKKHFPNGTAEVIIAIVKSQIKVLQATSLALSERHKESVSPFAKDALQRIIRKYGWTFILSSPEFLHEHDLVLTALEQNLAVARFIGENLHLSRKFILDAVRTNGLALYFLGNAWKDDVDVVRTAAEQNGRAIQFASPRVRKHFCVARAAVFQDESAREFLDPSLQGDLDVSLASFAGFLQKNMDSLMQRFGLQ